MKNTRLPRWRLKFGYFTIVAGPLGIVIAVFWLHGNALVFGLSMLAIAAVWMFGRSTVICPKCEKKKHSIGIESECCYACGTPYFPVDADKEKKPNQAPEPTAPSGRGSS
jgi:zinc transporter ZupT